MNRALICSSYSKDLELIGSSSCDDVIKMQQAIQLLKNYSPGSEFEVAFDAGAAGTVFRFLSLRLSRIPGCHKIKGSRRLMQRPQQDLLDVLTHLGVNYELTDESLIMYSEGWKNISRGIEVNRNVSSQFASGIILNAWMLNEDLTLKMHGNPISEGYLEMTVQVVKDLGMNITQKDSEYTIKAKSCINQKKYSVESDLSSLFAVAAFAVLNGKAEFENFPTSSLQPDIEFLNILKKMDVPITLDNNTLKIYPPKILSGVEVDLGSCPDLFPVLATLCAFASTKSRLYGAPQLIHKESDRISKISELLTKLKVPHQKTSDGMIIEPKQMNNKYISEFEYDTDHDHRLAFSAALVKSQNIPIKILHPEVVSKSFPEFWQVVGLE